MTKKECREILIRATCSTDRNTDKYILEKWNMRNRQGFGTLEEAAMFQAAKDKEAAKEYAKKVKLPVSKIQSLKSKAREICESFYTGHSMGCYVSLTVNNVPFVSVDKTDTYAKSCKWRATHGSVRIQLTPSDLKNIENIHGVWTVKTGANTCKILHGTGNKNTYSVVWKDCFLVGQSHGDTFEEATHNNMRFISAKIKELQDNMRFISAKMVHEKTGACWAGMQAFCNRTGLNIEYGYNVGFLKSLNDSIANRFLNKI